MVLEVADLEQSVAFYRELLGMVEVERWGDPRPAVWVGIGLHQVLGLWPRQSGGPDVGLYGSRGGAHVHFALYVAPHTLDHWQQHLLARGIDVKGPITFGGTNRSLYVTDPDGHVVELAEWEHDWAGQPVEATDRRGGC
jgi:catechol 2,3-dioxygenase-like lactoylglutathione lyase family enzyme